MAILLLFVGSHDARAQAFDSAEKQAVVARVGELLSERYVFPEKADQARDAITHALKAGAYDGITNPSTFAERLTDDLNSIIHDPHIKVFVSAEQFTAPSPSSLAIRPPMNAGFAAVDRLKGNIGYIKLNAFPSIEAFMPVARQAFSNLSSTSAMIIDLRENGGGDPES
ncbi:MAG: S41 family peptidase, partial [Rhizomicrobium sp.]